MCHCHFSGKYRNVTHSICNLRFNVPNETPVSFHSGSNYDYHFIIKELANEFEGQFQCLEENTEKFKTFSIPIEREVTNIDRGGNKSVITISYKIKFIDNARFMATSVLNLTEEIHKIKRKVCDCFLEYERIKENLKKYKCIYCNKDYSNKIDEELKKEIQEHI